MCTQGSDLRSTEDVAVFRFADAWRFSRLVFLFDYRPSEVCSTPHSSVFGAAFRPRLLSGTREGFEPPAKLQPHCPLGLALQPVSILPLQSPVSLRTIGGIWSCCRFSKATGLPFVPWSRSTPGGNLSTCPEPLGIFMPSLRAVTNYPIFCVGFIASYSSASGQIR